MPALPSPFSKVPLLGDIPWVGEAFTNRRESTKKVELVILLKTTVVKDDDTWANLISETEERISGMKTTPR